MVLTHDIDSHQCPGYACKKSHGPGWDGARKAGNSVSHQRRSSVDVVELAPTRQDDVQQGGKIFAFRNIFGIRFVKNLTVLWGIR